MWNYLLLLVVHNDFTNFLNKSLTCAWRRQIIEASPTWNLILNYLKNVAVGICIHKKYAKSIFTKYFLLVIWIFLRPEAANNSMFHKNYQRKISLFTCGGHCGNWSAECWVADMRHRKKSYTSVASFYKKILMIMFIYWFI